MERQVRYTELDLECDEGTEKRGKFSDMFKRSSKPTEPPVPEQDNCSVHSDLSGSKDSLSDNSNKEKGGIFGGVFKKPPKPSRTQSQDDLDDVSAHSDQSGSRDDLSHKTSKGGVMNKILRNPFSSSDRGQERAERPSQGSEELSKAKQDNLSGHSVLSASSERLSERPSKDKTDVLGGMFKWSSKPAQSSAPTPDYLSVGGDLSASNDGLSGSEKTTKEKGGMFSGVFKKSPKPSRTQSQDNLDDLSAHSDLSGSRDNLSEKTSKEKGGMFGGVFKKSPKPSRTQSQDNLDDLSAHSDLSGSRDNLSEKTSKEKGGMFSGVFKKSPKPSRTQSQDNLDDLSAHSDLSGSRDNLSEKTSKNKLVGALTKLNPFLSAVPKQEKGGESDSREPPEKQVNHKQNAVVGALSKMNPFRSASKKDTEEAETMRDGHKQEQDHEEKAKSVKSSILIWEGRKENTGTPEVPPRPTDEELRDTVTHASMQRSEAEVGQANGNVIPRARKERTALTPVAPLRPTEEELNRPAKRAQRKQKKGNQGQSDDEGLGEGESLTSGGGQKEGGQKEGGQKDEEEVANPADGKAAKVKKPKRHNPFMPRAGGKGKPLQKKSEGQEGTTDCDSAENEGGKKSLFDQLEELRVDRTDPDQEQDPDQDVENLMDWWNTVENWEDLPKDEDMTEKEEAKAFAVTAEKVQKGIRVFNKLFTERAESLWQHVIDLNNIADGLDKFNKKTKIAQITGGSTSAIGGVATIAGLALAPVTFGTSLIVTAVGLGVATAGGLTSAGAGISNQVNNSMDRKKVERIVEDYQDKMADINKCMQFIKRGIENLRKFDLLRMKKHAYNRDFPGLTNIYEDGAMVGKAILINANEIMRVVQIANVAGSTAARAVQIASMATGVLTGLFVGMDIYFVAKDSKELKKGAKSEFAAKIREVAVQLHDGLVELNGIRDELQSTDAPEGGGEVNPDAAEKAKFFDSSDDDDEIALFKKKNKMEAEMEAKDVNKDSKA